MTRFLRLALLLFGCLLLLPLATAAQGPATYELLWAPAAQWLAGEWPGDALLQEDIGGSARVLLRLTPAQARQNVGRADAALAVARVPAQATLFFIDGTARDLDESMPAVWPAGGQVVWQQKNKALWQGPAQPLQPLLAQGYRIIPLQTPLARPSQLPALPPPPTEASAVISDTIGALQATSVAAWDRRLSGEEWVHVGDKQLKFTSRYSWSTLGRRSERYVYERLQAMGYTPRYAPYTTPYNDTWRNIVLDIPGDLAPQNIVLLVAHLDSISFPLDNAPTQAPGADDNATGASALLAMADILRGQHFAYTLRLVWFTGEEFGYWGSRPYVQALAAENAAVVAAINLDMLGYDGDGDRVLEMHTGTLEPNQLLGDHLQAANQLYHTGLTIERKSSSASRFSDHRSFWEHGYASLLLIENFFADSDEDIYPQDRNPAYHSTGDQFALLDLDYVTSAARMALAAAMHLAQPLAPEEWPTATPTPTPLPQSCRDLVVNGGMEQDEAWLFGATPRQAGYSQTQPHTGLRSLRTGIPQSTGNTRSHSSAYQSLTLPADAAAIDLYVWLLAAGGDNHDYSEILLLRTDRSLLKLLWREAVQTAGWEQKTFDLRPWAGQDVLLYLNTYNDGANGNAWAYFDDASVVACTHDPSLTPTPTTTPSPSPTVTPSPTPGEATPTSTPTPSPTATPTTTPSPSPTPTPTPPPGETTPTSTPTPSPTATPTPLCNQIIINPDFEAADGWTFALTASQGSYTTQKAHHGQQAARLGLLPGQNSHAPAAREGNLIGQLAPQGATYSTVYQRLSLPPGSNIQIQGWLWPGTQAATGDWQRVLILDAESKRVRRTLYHDLEDATGWRFFSDDLSAYAGDDILLYFEVYNNSTRDAARTWMFVDDLQMNVCPAGITPTPTPILDQTLYLPHLLQPSLP